LFVTFRFFADLDFFAETLAGKGAGSNTATGIGRWC
jgi:hypothetical protein